MNNNQIGIGHTLSLGLRAQTQDFGKAALGLLIFCIASFFDMRRLGRENIGRRIAFLSVQELLAFVSM